MICGGVSMVFGPESRSYPTLWTGQSKQIGGSAVAELSLVIVGAAIERYANLLAEPIGV
jgi:branched-chain amino acid transport system permease protein